jgi:hypothetical protein
MGIATINDGVECFQRIHLQNKGSPFYKLKLESQSESKQVYFVFTIHAYWPSKNINAHL